MLKRGLALAQRIGYSRGEIRVLYAWQDALENHGDIPQSLELNFKALQIAKENHYTFETAIGLSNIGSDYWDLQDYPRAISFYKKSIQINKRPPNTREAKDLQINTELSIGDAYSKNEPASTLRFSTYKKPIKKTLNNDWHPAVLLYLGDVLFKMGDHKTA